MPPCSTEMASTGKASKQYVTLCASSFVLPHDGGMSPSVLCSSCISTSLSLNSAQILSGFLLLEFVLTYLAHSPRIAEAKT